MTRGQLVTMLEHLALDVRNIVEGCRLAGRCCSDPYAVEVMSAARSLEGRLSNLLARVRGGAHA